MFSGVLVPVRPPCPLSRPAVWDADAQPERVAGPPVFAPGGPRGSHGATWDPCPPGTLRPLTHSQCALPFLGEAETSRSRWESQPQTAAFSSRQAGERPPGRAPSPAGLGLLRGQSTMGRRSFSSGVTAVSATGHCQRDGQQTDRRMEGRKEGASFGSHISGSRAREPQVNKQLASGVLGPCGPSRWPPSGPALRRGGKAPRASSYGNPRFPEERVEILVSQRREWLDCVSSGGRRPGSLRTATGEPRASAHTPSSGGYSQPLASDSSILALRSTPLETRGGGCWVCLLRVRRPPVGSRRPFRGEAGPGGAHTGVVRRLSILKCRPSFRSCWKKSCTCRKPASRPGL